MALKLKLKMPSSSASNSPATTTRVTFTGTTKTTKTQNQSAIQDTSFIDSRLFYGLKRPQEEQSTGENPKLKLSLSKTKENGRPKGLPRVRIKPTRIPGEGYDSEAPDLEDDPLIEQGIIIRF